MGAAPVMAQRQTPSGPLQGAVHVTVQGTQKVGEGAVQGAGPAGAGIVRVTRTVIQRVNKGPGGAVTGTLKDAGQATVGVAKGAGKEAKKTGKGFRCSANLGYA